MLHHKYSKIFISFLLLIIASTSANAQKLEKVHGKYSYTIGENERITLFEMKQRCILHAQNEAIKEKFNEIISANTNIVDASINGKTIENFIDEVTVNSCAEWLGDTQPPVFTASYKDGQLTFTAEVWGEAREIVQSKPDFDWKILCGGTTDRYENNLFKNRERIYIKFRAPADGYVAIYLLDSTDGMASCLLPYKYNSTGYHKIKAGEQYLFFDSNTDPNAIDYSITTSAQIEMDNIVVIYSPNQFVRCNDKTSDSKHPNSVSTKDFEKWLRKLRNSDKKLVVDRSRWITITNE